MNWKFIDNGNAQEDEVGNILQKSGGVVPKACQSCKVIFTSDVVRKEIKQKIPSYNCDNCNFDGNTGDQAFGHTIDQPTHKISRTTKSRIVGYKNTIEGILSYVTKTEDDVKILCGKCN
jgi:hypothetical protein